MAFAPARSPKLENFVDERVVDTEWSCPIPAFHRSVPANLRHWTEKRMPEMDAVPLLHCVRSQIRYWHGTLKSNLRARDDRLSPCFMRIGSRAKDAEGREFRQALRYPTCVPPEVRGSDDERDVE